jgi:hypothetical protein
MKNERREKRFGAGGSRLKDGGKLEEKFSAFFF